MQPFGDTCVAKNVVEIAWQVYGPLRFLSGVELGETNTANFGKRHRAWGDQNKYEKQTKKKGYSEWRSAAEEGSTKNVC